MMYVTSEANKKRGVAKALVALAAFALISTAPASANPGAAVGCGVNVVNATIHTGAYYYVFVTNPTNAAIPSGTLMNWSVQSIYGAKAGGQYLPSTLAPHASEYLVEVPLANIAAPARASSCSAATASTFTAPDYGSGSGSISGSHGKPVRQVMRQ